jgi:transposase-like protein
MPRRHSPETRAKALRMIEEVGVNETARRTGISRGQLYAWRHPEAMKRYSEAAAKRQNTAACPVCGGPMRRPTTSACMKCRKRLWDEVELAYYQGGQTPAQIAEIVGVETKTIKNAIRMRRRRRKQER